jgi:DNA-binding NarL/FixJ family response regulator
MTMRLTYPLVVAMDPDAAEHRATLLEALEMRKPNPVPATRFARPLAIHDTELIAQIGEGLTNRQIARRLGEDEGAVQQRVALLYARTGARSRVQLALLAVRMGWIEWDETVWAARPHRWPAGGVTP